ncbi:MAG TPA: nucleotidyltransferase family protein [Methanocorpusculum sp.]|nr:nucleotidyltransferase family protein [Methanocorpusculum sp.]HJJ39547.1 nucleotidyltransferase family protein [Methanocorpusculum sp.]
MTAEYTSIRKPVMEKLEANLPELQRRFGVADIAVFGSVARGEDTADSDVDILYRFADDNQVTTALFFEFAAYLETLFGRKTDLVSFDYIDPYIRPYVEKDMLICGAKPAAEAAV